MVMSSHRSLSNAKLILIVSTCGLLMAVLVVACTTHNDRIYAKLLSTGDGDTRWDMQAGKPLTVRLARVDALVIA